MIDLVFHGCIKQAFDQPKSSMDSTCTATRGYSPTCSRKDARTGTCKATSKKRSHELSDL